MVLIQKYKGYNVEYNEGKFYYKYKKDVSAMFEKESQVITLIDQRLADVEKTKKQEEEKKKLEQERKELEKKKVVFNAIKFKEFFQKVALYTTECRLVFDHGLMTTIMMDPANVAMVYRVESYKGKLDNYKTAVNAVEVSQCLKSNINSRDKEATVTVRFGFNPEKMIISNGFGEYSVPLVELESRVDKVPDLKWVNTFYMDRKEFYDIVQRCAKVAESFKISVKNKKLYITAEGDLVGYKKEVMVVDGPDSLVKLSTEYCKKKYFNSDRIKVEVSTDYPLRLSDDDGNWFILAPRVDNE